MEPFTQDRIPYWYSPITEVALTGRWITSARNEPGLRRLGGPGRSLPIGPKSTWAKATVASL